MLSLYGAGNFLSGVFTKNPAPKNNQPGAGKLANLLRRLSCHSRRRKVPCPAFGKNIRRRRITIPAPERWQAFSGASHAVSGAGKSPVRRHRRTTGDGPAGRLQ